jgi:hypothetical protein
MPCIVINAPEWFKDPGFIKMINYNGEEPGKFGTRRAATWHIAGQEPDEYSDVFMTWGVKKAASASSCRKVSGTRSRRS